MTAASPPTAPTSRGPRWSGRILWSMLSQGLSSVTNFMVIVLLAVTESADAVGRIIAVLSVYLLAVTLARSLVGDVLVAASDGTPEAVTSAEWTAARGRIGAMAPPAAVGAMALGLALGVELPVLAAIVVPLPLLLVQDGQRHLAWARGRPGAASAIDGCWLLVAGVTIAVWSAVADGDVGAVAVVASWSVGGVCSWAMGRTIVEPSVSTQPVAALRSSARDDGGARYSGLARSQALMAVAVNLGPIIVAVGAGPTSAAVVKTLLIPFTPILSLVAGLRVVTLPATRRAIDRGATRGPTATLIAALSAAALTGSVASIMAIGALDIASFGESLALVAPYLGFGAVLCLLYVAGQQLADAAALTDGSRIVTVRLVAIAAEWSGLLVGAALGGTRSLIIGWVAGLALATAILALHWFTITARAGRQTRPVSHPQY